MYKYSWKTALMTIGFAGQTALVSAKADKSKALSDVSKEDVVKEKLASNGDGMENIQVDVTNLQNRIKELDGNINTVKQAVDNMPPDLTYAVIGVAIFALLLAMILVAIIRRKAARDAKKINDLRRELDHQHNLLENLNRRLNDIQETSVKPTFLKERYPENVAYPQSAASMHPESAPLASARVDAVPVMPKSQADPLKKLNEKCSEFAKEYNRIQSIQGLEAKTAKQDFQRKYGLCGFVCVNADERVNHPEIPPKFKVNESLVDASIWGFQFDAYYLVAPKPQKYVGNDHNYGGMKELFKSNFQQGCTYSKIKLNKPAIMTQDLQIIWRQGDLQLN